MAITGIGGNPSPLLQAVRTIDGKLEDLQRQLGTGQKSDTYSGLGSQASVAVGLSAQLAALSSYGDAISTVGTNIDLAQSALTQIASASGIVKNAAEVAPFDPGSNGVTGTQRTAQGQLDAILAALNTQGANGYMFSGTASNQQSVESEDHILNGNGSKAGLVQVIADV